MTVAELAKTVNMTRTTIYPYVNALLDKDIIAEITYYKEENCVKKIYEEALRAKELRSYPNLAIMRILPEVKRYP